MSTRSIYATILMACFCVSSNAYNYDQSLSSSFKMASQGRNYITGPDGSRWSYSARYEMEDVYYNEYYTDHIVHSFTFQFYDSSNRLVGTVHDEIRYGEGEVRERECVVAPLVTRNFFNLDDKPEIMVFHAINTESYVNNYYYDVYSIGGEKDKDGNDKVIHTIKGRLIESIDNSSAVGSENYYFTFVQDPVIDFPLSDPDYVAKLNETSYHLTTYKKVKTDGEEPGILIEKDIFNNHIPGDTTEGIYYMSKRADGRLFVIYSQYEKPFFIDPRGMAEDERATPDNSLKIEVYELTHDTADFISKTLIPVEAETSTEQLIYTFMGIGEVTYKDDVDMSFHGTPDSPAFIVKRSVCTAADVENMISSYYICTTDGNKKITIAENVEKMYLYRNGDPGGPLGMFVIPESDGYEFRFVFIFSGELQASISQANNGDPLYASAYPVRRNGEYKYVFEMKNYELDKYDNTYSRVAWFGDGGNLERIDRINLGKDVQASQVYLSDETLNPELFDKDEFMEYAVLVKRTYGNTIRNEYLISDDNGGRYATYSSDDGLGEPYNLTINGNRMTVQYRDNNRINSVTINLPFTTESEGALDFEPKEEEEAGINVIESDVLPIEYFDINGNHITTPTKGIYIRKQGGKTQKIIVN